MKRNIFITILSGFLMLPSTMAAETDGNSGSGSPLTAHTIGFELRPAWVPPTNSYLRREYPEDPNISSTVSPHLRYSFKFSPDTKEGAFYPHTYQGIGLSYTQFFEDTDLGHPVTLYLFQGSRIASLSQRLSLDYEWNFGASAGWKKSHPLDPYPLKPVGSNVNAYINVPAILQD